MTPGRRTARSSSVRLGKHVEVWREQSAATLNWLAEHQESVAAATGRQYRVLLASTLISHTRLASSLDAPTAERPVSVSDYAATAVTGRDVTLGEEMAATSTQPQLLADLRLVVSEISERLSQPEVPAVARASRAAVAVSDLLRLSVVHWLVLLQLASRTAPDLPAVPTQRQASADAVRVLLQILAERHPGAAIEVRVPPYGAVQIGSGENGGPAHTRGTPPAVVETDPAAWVLLAVGAAEFGELRADGTVTASGAHADIGHLFPLL